MTTFRNISVIIVVALAFLDNAFAQTTTPMPTSLRTSTTSIASPMPSLNQWTVKQDFSDNEDDGLIAVFNEGSQVITFIQVETPTSLINVVMKVLNLDDGAIISSKVLQTNNPWNMVVDILRIPDKSGYMVLASRNDNFQFEAIRLDNNGDQMDFGTTLPTNFLDPRLVVNNGRSYVVGAQPVGTGSLNKFAITSLDNNGALNIGSVVLSSTPSFFIDGYATNLASNGDVIIVATVLPSSGTDRFFVIIKVDPATGVISLYNDTIDLTDDPNKNVFPGFIIETSDGGLLFPSTLVSTGQTACFPFGETHNGFLTKTDATGNEIWTQSYDVASLNDSPLKAIEMPNGRFMIAGDSFYEDPNNCSKVKSKFMMKIDQADGSKIWGKTYPINAGKLSFTDTGTSGFIIGGSFSAGWSVDSETFIRRTNSSGNYGQAF